MLNHIISQFRPNGFVANKDIVKLRKWSAVDAILKEQVQVNVSLLTMQMRIVKRKLTDGAL